MNKPELMIYDIENESRWKKFLKNCKSNWDKILTIFISSLALIFAIAGWYSQHNAVNEYTENTNQVLKNSADIAIADIDLMAVKAKLSETEPIQFDRINFQVESLEQNLKMIEDIQITNLPKDESMNYQVYRLDLYNVIYKEKSYISDLRDQANQNNKSKSGTDIVVWNKKERLKFIDELMVIREMIKNERDALNKNESLYDLQYKDYKETLEEVADNLQKETDKELGGNR